MKIKLGNRERWLLIFAVVFFVHLITLLRYPPPFVDEAWLVSRAWAFLQTGHQSGPLDLGVVDQFEGYWILNQWLITFLQAQVLRFFTQPELLPLRVLSLVEGAGLMMVSYLAADRLGGRRVAIYSTLLLGVSRIFFHTAHMVRYDILAAFLVYTSLAIVVNDRRRRFWSGLAAGVLLGLAMETHLNSLIFFPTLVLYFLIDYRGSIHRHLDFWGFLLGSSFGAVSYLYLHVLPYPDTFFTVNMLLFGETQTPPLLSLNFFQVLKGFSNAFFLLLIGSGPMLIMGLAAIPLLIHRKTREGQKLLAINIALWVGAALVFPNSMGHYAIYLAPAFYWLVVEFLLDYNRRPWRGKFIDFASRAIVWGAVVGSLALTVELLIPNGYQAYQRAQDKVDVNVLPGDTIMGPQVYWFGLYDHLYYSWELLFIYPRFFPGKTLEDAFQYYRPDIFIIDGNMQPYISDTIDPSDRWYYYRVSKNELYRYLRDHAQLVSIPDNISYYGSPVQVYRLIWSP